MAICGSWCKKKVCFWLELPSSICWENALLSVEGHGSCHWTMYFQDSCRQISQTADTQSNAGTFSGTKSRSTGQNYSFLVPKVFSCFCLFLLPSEKAGFFVNGGCKRYLYFLKDLMYKGQQKSGWKLLQWKSCIILTVLTKIKHWEYFCSYVSDGYFVCYRCYGWWLV